MIRLTSWLLLPFLIFLTARPTSAQGQPPAPPPFSEPLRSPSLPPPVVPEGRGDSVSDLARMFAPSPAESLDQVWAMGQTATGPVPVLTWERVYHLALTRAGADAPPKAETLDPARLAEQARRLGLDDFGRARPRLAAREFRDPAAEFLNLQAQLGQITTARTNLAASERWLAAFQELTAGESFGLNEVDLGRFQAAVVVAGRDLGRSIATYRDSLDRFKVSLGLAPSAVLSVDLGPLDAFAATFAAIDRWRTDPRHEAHELVQILKQLPAPGDVSIGGRPALAEAEPGRLEAILGSATQLALANRRDGDAPADEVELRVRRRVRHLLELRADYALEARSLALSTQMADANFEQIIAPPNSGAPRPALAVIGVLDATRQSTRHRDRLVALWAEFRAERLALARDLGTVEGTDWPTYLNQFQAGPIPAFPAPRERPPLDDRAAPEPVPVPDTTPPPPPPPPPPARTPPPPRAL